MEARHRWMVWPLLLLLPAPTYAQQPDTVAPQPRDKGYAQLTNLRMYYEVYGNGRPLLLLHGGGGTIQNFSRQLAYFSKDRLIIAPEQMGQGHTPDANRPLNYTAMADNTAQLLERLHVKDADVLGWSDGGILGLILAIRYPSLVRRLAITGANVRPGRDAITEAMIADLRAYKPEEDTAGRRLYANLSPDSANHYSVIMHKLVDLWLNHPTASEVTLYDLGKVKAPTLVIAGDHDVIRLDETLAIYQGIPQAALFIVPGTGHPTVRDRPEWLNPILQAFFEETRPPSEGSP